MKVDKEEEAQSPRMVGVQNLPDQGFFFSLPGGDSVNSAFWSLSVMERPLVWRTAEGLKRDQSPLRTVRPLYMWLSPNCWLGGAMKKKGVKSFKTRDMLVYEPSWCFSDDINVAWLSLKGIFILCTFNERKKHLKYFRSLFMLDVPHSSC